MIESDPSTHNDTAYGRLVECGRDADCEILGPGHGLSLMRRRLAEATPSKWIDALIEHVSDTGIIDIARIDDGTSLRFWHHADNDLGLVVGDPVAVHSVYGVLAAGKTWLNVAGRAL
jgi:hypothetical protein